MKKRVFLRTLTFLIVLLVLLSSVSMLLESPGDSRVNYQWIHSFYDEPKNTLDGVLIGSSHAFTGWLAPLAWERYGITVWPFTSSRQTMLVSKELIEEARKTQPDAVYIVELNYIDTSVILKDLEAAIHDLTDPMPMSLQRFKIVNKMSDYGDYSFADRLEYYFPLLRYHSQWTEMEERNFSLSNNGVKGACTRHNFLYNISNMSSNLQMTDEFEETTEITYDILEELFQYCESEKVKCVFLLSPMVTGDLDRHAQRNTLKKLCEERGFPVIDERLAMDEIGIDPNYDYYNKDHTNIHGALKMTDYVSRYLIEHFELQDKRGTPGYESWDEAYITYRGIADSYTLDFEWDASPRDTTLNAPTPMSIEVSGTAITVSWKEIDGAEGYRIYRKPVTEDEDPPGWEPVAEVGKNTLEYTDTELEANATYCYTAVPFRKENDVYCFGRVTYAGVTGTALLNAPSDLELSGTEDALTLSWKKVKGAEGYEISRGILADIADRIETDVGKETSFRDTLLLPGVPYGYQVRSYRYDEAGEKVYSSWSAETIWVPERSGPDVAVELVDGIPTLTWESMAGVTGYWVNRKEGSGEWEPMAADALSPSCTTFQDITAKKGTKYSYRIQAFLEYEGETYRYNSQIVKITAKKTGIELPAPEILLCEQVGDKIYTVWEPVESATNYRVYRYRWDEETETWVDKSTVKITNPACQQSPAKSGRYLFVVRALYEGDEYTNLGTYDIKSGKVVEYHKSEE